MEADQRSLKLEECNLNTILEDTESDDMSYRIREELNEKRDEVKSLTLKAEESLCNLAETGNLDYYKNSKEDDQRTITEAASGCTVGIRIKVRSRRNNLG